jgi:hypothetical protein
MMNVGSISGACAVGGRKGVGVVAGEQAESETRIKTTVIKSRLGEKRSVTIKEKGDPLPSRPTGILQFFRRSGAVSATVIAASDVERQGNFATEGLLSNNSIDLGHQFRILAQVVFGVLTTLTDTDVAV